MTHASFSKEQYKLAKARPDTVRLAHVTVRDPVTNDAMTISLILDLSTANELMNFMLGATTAKEPGTRAVIIDAP